jgi:hypothetical protein
MISCRIQKNKIYYKNILYKSNMWLNHKFCAMVACHLNFQFQVLALLKRTKKLVLANFIVDVPLYSSPYILANYNVFQCWTITRFQKAIVGMIFSKKCALWSHSHICTFGTSKSKIITTFLWMDVGRFDFWLTR